MKANNNGVELNFEVRGQGEPSLLFIHGLGGSVRVWDAAVERFSKERRVAAMDVRGHGNSARPGSYPKHEFADDARAVARAAGLERPMIVGWSLGGAVALDYAVRYPAELSGIVLVDHNAHIVKTQDVRLGMEPEYLERLMQLLRDDYEGAGTDELVESWMSDGQEHLTEIRSQLKQSLLTTSKETVQAIRGTPWGDRVAVMRQVKVPTLVLQGTGSRLGGTGMADYLQEHIPHARVHLFQGHGHALHLTASQEFERVLEAFIREVEGAPA